MKYLEGRYGAGGLDKRIILKLIVVNLNQPNNITQQRSSASG
jgi:hypothetical protein